MMEQHRPTRIVIVTAIFCLNVLAQSALAFPYPGWSNKVYVTGRSAAKWRRRRLLRWASVGVLERDKSIKTLTVPKSRASVEVLDKATPKKTLPEPPEINPHSLRSELDWSFLDAAFLITCPNADPQSVRLNKTKKVLTEVGLLDKVIIKEFETDDLDRIRGCYSSHIAIMKEAVNAMRYNEKALIKQPNQWWQRILPSLKSDAKRPSSGVNEHQSALKSDAKILVLEDNVESGGSLQQSTIDALSEFANNGSGWNQIMLSYIPYVPNLVVSRVEGCGDSIVKLSCGIGSALGTTAYIINLSGIEAILKRDSERGYYAAIPDVMAELFPESRYAVSPTPFLRGTTKSLVNPQLDDLRALLFQPAVVAFSQQLLTSTGLSTNALLPLIVVALLIVNGFAGRISVDAAWALATTGAYDGNAVVPIMSSMFSFFSLLILAQGAALAPKQPPQEESDRKIDEVALEQ